MPLAFHLNICVFLDTLTFCVLVFCKDLLLFFPLEYDGKGVMLWCVKWEKVLSYSGPSSSSALIARLESQPGLQKLLIMLALFWDYFTVQRDISQAYININVT